MFKNLLFVLGLTAALLVVSATESYAQQRYTYSGREVSKEYFDAVNIARDASPLLQAGKYGEAEPLLRKAAEVASDDPDILQNYALALVKTGKAKEAVAVYQKIAVLSPESESCWIGWCGAYGALGQLEDSLRVCREFLKKFPKSSVYPQMKNQAETIEKEVKRLAKSGGASESADNYLTEARVGGAHQWNSRSMPLKVFIESGESVPGWKPVFDEIMKQAFLDWQQVSNGRVAFEFVDSSKKANIRCFWTSDLSKLKNSAEQGETDTSWADNNELFKASIMMLTVPSVNQQLPLSELKVRQTALHEVGHALGINGHSRNPDDIMYFATIAVPEPHLSERDARTLRMIYGEGSVEGAKSAN